MGEDGKKLGLAAAVAATGAEAPPVERAEQLPLLPAAELDGLPVGQAERTAVLRAPRSGPGRPPGARNRSTQAWRDYLLSKYRSPLEVLAETYSRSAQDLAAELNCKPAEAFAIQVKAAAELAPYLHGKMPVEVAVSGALPMLHLVAPEDALKAFRVEEGGMVLDLAALRPIEENQGVSEWSAQVSDGAKSDDGPETEAGCGFAAGGQLTYDQSPSLSGSQAAGAAGPGQAGAEAAAGRAATEGGTPPAAAAAEARGTARGVSEFPGTAPKGEKSQAAGRGAGTGAAGEGDR